MVAHLVRLKLTLLRNALRRSVGQLIGIVLGGLYGLFVLGMLVAAAVGVRVGTDVGPAAIATVVTLLGAATTLGWGVVPLVAFGVDQTLDPVRFATFAVPRRDLVLGMTAAALVGVPGVLTAIGAMCLVIVWSTSVGAALTAVVAAVVGVLTCVVLSRAVTAATAALSQSRRGRELVTALTGTVLILVPVGAAQAGPVLGDVSTWQTVATVLGWTPLGLAWSAPGEVAQGHLAAGAGRLVLSLVVLAGLLALWERLLLMALLDPRARSSAGGHTPGLGWFQRLPATPTGVVAAREVTYYRRDPRYMVSLGMLPVLPLLLLVPYYAERQDFFALAVAPAAGYFVGWSLHNDVAYDGTAFWLHVATGVSGRADRLGRLAPFGVIGLVLVIGYAVLGCAVSGAWDSFFVSLGLGLALLGAGAAVSLVASALKPYPVAQAGENPFSSPPGAAGLTITVQFAASGLTTLLAVPTGLVAAAAVFWASWLAPVVTLVGLATGAAYLVLGLRLGAGVYERRGPDLLADLTRAR